MLKIKTMAVAIMALFAANTAHAQVDSLATVAPYAAFGYTFQDFRGAASGSSRGGGIATLGNRFSKNLAVEISGGTFDMPLNSGGLHDISYRVDAAVIPSYSVGAFTGFVRAAVGQAGTRTDNWSFYRIEPGVSMAVTQNITLSGSYQLRDSFDKKVNDQAGIYRAVLGYKLTKNMVFTLGYDRSTGHTKYDGYSAGLGFYF